MESKPARPGLMTLLSELERTLAVHHSRPGVDVLERDGDCVLRLEMPGISPEDVRLEWKGSCLVVAAEHAETGKLRRTFWLPTWALEGGIGLRAEKGILEVRLQAARAGRRGGTRELAAAA